MRTLTKEMQMAITPEMALSILKEGNNRFINNLKLNRNYLEQVNETSQSQHPFAVILSCIDSRTSSELIFDQGLGDIFSIRIAGNVLSEDILGSMEFACKIAGAKMVVVLGHTHCGAVKGACSHVEMGNLTPILSKIRPAIDEETSVVENRTADNETFVEKVTLIHVKRTMKGVMERSAILKEMIEDGSIGITGAMYDITTGRVTFYEEEEA